MVFSYGSCLQNPWRLFDARKRQLDAAGASGKRF
jgi:hypothetical protein